MTRPGALLLVSLALAAAGCAGHPLARLDVARQATGLTSCTFDLAGSSLYQRGVLYVQPTTSLQVTVEATDLATRTDVWRERTDAIDDLLGRPRPVELPIGTPDLRRVGDPFVGLGSELDPVDILE